jgi:hypothetical protein
MIHPVLGRVTEWKGASKGDTAPGDARRLWSQKFKCCRSGALAEPLPLADLARRTECRPRQASNENHVSFLSKPALQRLLLTVQHPSS